MTSNINISKYIIWQVRLNEWSTEDPDAHEQMNIYIYPQQSVDKRVFRRLTIVYMRVRNVYKCTRGIGTYISDFTTRLLMVISHRRSPCNHTHTHTYIHAYLLPYTANFLTFCVPQFSVVCRAKKKKTTDAITQKYKLDCDLYTYNRQSYIYSA